MTQPVPVLSISQITQAIKLHLENHFSLVRLQGEVSNLRKQASGHLYFTLKDTGAQISAVMFRGDQQGLQRLPQNGDQLLVEGSINVYPPRGNYQMIVRHLAPVGLGELLLRYERLKAQLQARGWFDSAHKKPIPSLPRCIGVVSSPSGAAIQDMLNVLRRRFSGFQLLLNPVLVQGTGAAEQIAAAITQFNHHQLADVIIVARGGGSIEDLWAFNEELVASAIYHSSIPVISAVGHETDHCLCDFVADLRAPTPSAAAELVMDEKVQKQMALKSAQTRLDHSIRQTLQRQKERLKQLSRQGILSSPYTLLGPHLQRMDDWHQHLQRDSAHRLSLQKNQLDSLRRRLQSVQPSTRITEQRRRLHALSKQLEQSMERYLRAQREALSPGRKQGQLDSHLIGALNRRQERLKQMQQHAIALNPKNLLDKGYSIIFSEKSTSVINSVEKLNEGESLRILVSDGEAAAIVQKIRSHASTTQ